MGTDKNNEKATSGAGGTLGLFSRSKVAVRLLSHVSSALLILSSSARIFAATSPQTPSSPPVPPEPVAEISEAEKTNPVPTSQPPLAQKLKAVRDARRSALKSASSATNPNGVTVTIPESMDQRLFTPTFKQDLLRMGLDENQMRIFAWKTRSGGRGVEPLNTVEREQRRDAIKERLQSILEHYESKETQGTLTPAEAQQQRRLQEVAKLFDKNKNRNRDNDWTKEKEKEKEKEKAVKKPQDGGVISSPDARPGKIR